MKIVSRALIAGLCCLPLWGVAAEYSEKEILHATFVAFQEPGILSEEYIAEKRRVLQEAAKAGNVIAQLVVGRSSVGRPSDSAAVLHATFAVFQEPGVLSEAYIAKQRRVLEAAAAQGDAFALLVVARHQNATLSTGTRVSLLEHDSHH